MLPQRMKKAITDNPKKLANLIDLVNLPSTLREFVGQSQISRLGCFMQVWSYIKTNNLQVLTTPFLFQHFSNESDFLKKKKKTFL
jgi:chromatin remodeling complex protein RSC6